MAAVGYLIFAVDAMLAAAGRPYPGRFVVDQVAYLAIAVGLGIAELDEAADLRSAAVSRLAGTMGHVLRGHANVCSRCHRVEDQSHEWRRPEVFVKTHTEADVTHGICPSCIEQHFPEQAAKWGHAETDV